MGWGLERADGIQTVSEPMGACVLYLSYDNAASWAKHGGIVAATAKVLQIMDASPWKSRASDLE